MKATSTPEKKFTSIRSRNLWQPHFRTFCELVEGEENKLTTFSIMLGCNESNINSGEAMVEIHKYSLKKFMAATLSYFL